ncbi:hypothetical protein [Achromobacter insolitus]|uniref:hypothetical protein n=1 Tax=Achromobacter insolitus TaxID=217204 RepID=UPI002FDF3864
MNLLGDKDVIQRVETLWAKVFQSSNAIIRHAKLYGFLGIELIPSPNIHEIMLQLQAFDAVFDILLSQQGDMHYDQAKQLLNAKSQLLIMGRVASALKANKVEDFEMAIQDLERQAVV